MAKPAGPWDLIVVVLCWLVVCWGWGGSADDSQARHLWLGGCEGGGSSRETSVRQWQPPVLALAQPQAQPVRGAAHVSPSPRPAPPCPGMPPGPGPSLLRAFHQALTANPSRLKTQDRGENGERFIFRKWGVGAHHWGWVPAAWGVQLKEEEEGQGGGLGDHVHSSTVTN